MQKIQLLIAAFVLKIRRQKIPAPKHGDFDLDAHQNSLDSTEGHIVPGFFSAASLSFGCCFGLPLPAAVLSDDRTQHTMQTLLNSSFHISSWCVQVIWPLYLFDPLFFFLKESVLVLPIETHGGKLLEDNTW